MKTLVIGASEKTERYSNKAIKLLLHYGHKVVAIGSRKGNVDGVSFDKELVAFEGVDTVTLYVNSTIQKQYYDYIISLKPRRVVFNPGTENLEFEALLQKNNIETEEACTLVLLNTGQF